MLRRIVFAGAVAAAFAANANSVAAQSVQDFYKGKTITLLIGIGVGGGTDAWARTVGQYIGRHIPGNPSVVPENMPGAAGLKMTDYIYNAAPRDGSVIGLPNAGILLEPLLGGQGAGFDPMKLNFIGSPIGIRRYASRARTLRCKASTTSRPRNSWSAHRAPEAIPISIRCFWPKRSG